MKLESWWMCSSIALVATLAVADAHAQKPKDGAAATSCEAILQAGDAPRTVLVARAATCYLDTGKNVQAVKLLQAQLDQMEQEGAQGGRGALEERLQTALAKVAILDIKTEAGAEISVNGLVIGKYPAVNPVFVEPGNHLVEARLGKAEAMTSIHAAAANQSTVELKLETPAATTPPPNEPSKTTKWPGWRIAMTIAGGVVGIGGLGMGIGSAASASGTEDERAKIVAAFPMGSSQCAVTPDIGDCKRIATLVQDRDDAWRLTQVGFIAGAVGMGVAITALVLPVRTDAAKKKDTTVTFLPLAGGAALTMRGSF
ncbi:MAG: hypothetical protein IPM54_30730 [Polyangiaceae bacterium]|nr:hypothetical protein [Polyangiaceae bacterium]